MKIEQIMNQPAVTCRRDDNLHTAARLMWEHDCGALPVTDGNGRVVGMLTDRDICMATFTQGKAPQAIAVSVAMSKEVFSCQPIETIEAAEKLMSARQIRRVPVVDKDLRIVGVLSLNDIARHGSATRKKDNLERDVVRTITAICEPRHSAIEVTSQVTQ